MDLGSALYREITGRSPASEITTFQRALDYLIGGKSVSAAARDLGVARSTLRGWIAGRTPRGGRRQDIVDRASREQRRARLPRRREQRMRDNGLSGLTVIARYQYDSGPVENFREVDLGQYLADVADQLLDAYLDGAPVEDLAEIFHEAIHDSPFYEKTFDPTLDDEIGWDIRDIRGWA